MVNMLTHLNSRGDFKVSEKDENLLMEKWYRTDCFFGKYGDPIKIIEADKSSDKSIWINGQRNLIRTSDYNYFKTFDEAKNFLLDRWSKKIDSLKSALRIANKTFDRIMDQQER